MTLPASRNTTYSPASPVKAADLNAIQDAIVQRAAGDQILELSPLPFNATTFPTNSSAVAESGGAGSFLMVEIPLHVGDRIKQVKVWTLGDDAVDASFTVARLTHSTGAAATLGGALVLANISSTRTERTIDVTDTVLDGTFRVFFQVSGVSAGFLQISSIRVFYDHPIV